MDTKRCAYCHKLVRADAYICSGCGRAFVPKKSGPSFVGVTQPSLPAASPHRAGHYSGLHPEDQPYQSSKMAIQRPAEPNADSRHLPPQEPAGILLPEVHTPPRLSSSRQITPPPDLDALPPIERMLPSPQRRKPFLSQERAIPILLALSCIFFLLASSILAFILLGKQSAVPISTAKLVASPDVLRVNDLFFLTGTNFGPNNRIIFTYDVGKPLLNGSQEQLAARANDKGFFQVQIRVPNTWGAGVHIIYATDEVQRLSTSAEITVQLPPSAPPYLQLSTSTLNLGSDRAGTVTSDTITLINKGGGQVSWQATSDAIWLTATPNANTFAGSQLVTVQVNRSSLAPQTYTGHISFAQKTGASPLTLTVTMAVKSASAALNISTRGAIVFSVGADQGASPRQTITLQNSGGGPLDWSSSVSTGDGSPWLFISPTSGRINPNTSQLVIVSVQPQQLPAGSYTGMIAFTSGASAQVEVVLNVLASGSLSVSLTSLSFTTFAGHSPSSKTLTLQNIGGQPLSWTASTGTANWLSVTPASGSLDPGEQATVAVSVNASPLTPGSYQGVITFGGGSPTPQVGVALTVNVPPAPAINVQSTSLNFTAYKGINPTPQTFTMANTGDATLNWTISEDGNGAAFAPVTPTSGQVSPGKSVSLTVSPNVLGYNPGTLTTVITVAKGDSGTKVPSQKIAVTITILDQANITLADDALSFTNTSTTPGTSQSLNITNSGSADLNWTVTLNETDATTVNWLSVDVSSGAIAPGTNSVIDVHCNSSQLSPGTYTATLTVSDSDSGTPVAPQSVQITLVVQ